MAGDTHRGKKPRADVRVALPLLQRSQVAMVALAIVIVIDLLALYVDFEVLSVADRLSAGERVSFADLNQADSHYRTSAIAQGVSIVLTAIFFLLWWSRAYRNAIATGIRAPRFGTRWAVIGWFVPLVSLVLPKQATNDIYRGSDPQMAYGDPDFASRPISPLLNWWWAAFLATGILYRLAGNGIDSATAEELSSDSKLYIAADIVSVIAAGLAIMMIRTITDRSEIRRLNFQATGTPDESYPAQPVTEPAQAPPSPQPQPQPQPPPDSWTPPPPPPPREPGEPPPADKSGSFGPPGYKG